MERTKEAGTLMKPTTNRTALVTVLAALSFGLTLLLFAQDLKLVKPGERLKPGNYYSWQLLAQNPKLPPPPLPGCPFPDLLVYAVDERNFIYDDREVDYAKLRAEAAEKAAAESEGKLDATGQMAMSMESYGTTNLWIEITAGSNAVTLTLHNTGSGTNYAFYSRSNVAGGLWKPEAFVAGGDGATAATIPMDGRTNLFFIAGVGDDTDGDGLSDMEERFTQTDPSSPDTGNTGISDGYKDPDGDGWSNLDELRNGTDPFGWDTPPAPFGVSLVSYIAQTSATVQWLPSPGAVTEYIIERAPLGQGYSEVARVNSTTFSFTDNQLAGINMPSYRITAVYSAGNSAASAAVTSCRADTSDFRCARGPAGRLYMIVPSVSSCITAVRLRGYYYDWQLYQYVERSREDIPASSLTNHVYPISESLAPPLQHTELTAQPLVGAEPAGSELILATTTDFEYYYTTQIPFLDGAEQLRQNAAFFLRMADSNYLFTAWFPHQTGRVPYDRSYTFPSDFVYANFLRRAEMVCFTSMRLSRLWRIMTRATSSSRWATSARMERSRLGRHANSIRIFGRCRMLLLTSTPISTLLKAPTHPFPASSAPRIRAG
jgi:hypothetical protein